MTEKSLISGQPCAGRELLPLSRSFSPGSPAGSVHSSNSQSANTTHSTPSILPIYIPILSNPPLQPPPPRHRNRRKRPLQPMPPTPTLRPLPSSLPIYYYWRRHNQQSFRCRGPIRTLAPTRRLRPAWTLASPALLRQRQRRGRPLVVMV